MHGTFYMTHAVGRRWIADKVPGNVVSITVTWVRNGSPYVVPSAMSKSAIHAMTMSLATEWGRYGIRLNTIAPGEIPTEGMSKRIKPGDEAGARTRAQNPMGRVGKMEELQNLAVFLISGGCDWISGETIAMDGAQALAMGGNFYQPARLVRMPNGSRHATASKRRTKRTRRSGGKGRKIIRPAARLSHAGSLALFFDQRATCNCSCATLMASSSDATTAELMPNAFVASADWASTRTRVTAFGSTAMMARQSSASVALLRLSQSPLALRSSCASS